MDNPTNRAVLNITFCTLGRDSLRNTLNSHIYCTYLGGKVLPMKYCVK